ncbi:MAG: TRZ/ATZ family hydrolase [Proteobacteria bacterium]|nr:TRZ/ATZ family hydrolase [Burkholderiales bacterium]
MHPDALPPAHPKASPPFDLALDAAMVLPIRPANRVLARHTVLVHAGKIEAILPTVDTDHYDIRERVDLSRHLLMPGLVNLHTHAAMALMRGLADDLPLTRWLEDHIWPTESAHVSARFVEDGTLLACAEMLRGGVTCFNDMYFYPEASARAALQAGMRASLGMIALDFPTPYATDSQDYLNKGLALRDGLRGESLLSFCFAPHAPYTVGDDTFGRVLNYARELETPIHIHLHETAQEIIDSEAAFGMRPLARLDRLGLIGADTIAVHAVHLDDRDVDTLARRGAHVAHCPSSNLKLASGFAPIARLVAAGINVGIGTDSAASNNRLDLFTELRLASLLAKAVSGAAEAVPAFAALEMATLRGACALGLDNRIGTLEPGKSADIIALDLSALELSPCYDPISQVTYAAGREHVTDVWVAGERRVADRALTSVDTVSLLARVGEWRSRLQRNAD